MPDPRHWAKTWVSRAERHYAILIPLVAVAGCSKHQNTEATGPPAIRHPSTVDVGRVDLNRAVHVSFDVANAGDAPLVIERAETDCQCQGVFAEEGMVAIRNLVVPPNGTVRLGMQFVAAGTIGISRTTLVRLRSNDPGCPVAVVTIKFTPSAALYAVPAGIVCTDQRADKPPVVQVDLFADGRSPLTTTEPIETNQPELFAARFLPAHADMGSAEKLGNSYAVRIGVLEIRVRRPPGDGSDFDGRVTILQKGKALLSIPVQIRYAREYLVSPSTLVLPRRVGDGWVYEAVIVCKRLDGRPFVLEASSPQPELALSVRAAPQDAGAKVVSITGRPSQEGTISAEVTLTCTTSDGGLYVARVPVRVRAKGE